MNKLTMALLCTVIAVPGSTAGQQASVEFGPVLRGTINVVFANQNGIVVLTDSMLTETQQNAQGIRTSRQLTTPGQKLFRIDDHTVCAFAGFAFADTTPLPEFLNSVSAIMGRYEDSLGAMPSTSFADKLQLLETVFAYYLTGIANIRDVASAGDYSFELLLAGVDVDGTPKVGRLILGTVSESAGPASGMVFQTKTQERQVFSRASEGMIFINGKSAVAEQILRRPKQWAADDPAVATYVDAVEKRKPLTIDQMKAFAISLKQLTAEHDREVGGPNQIAVVANGEVKSVEQPSFPAISLTHFKFRIVTTMEIDNGSSNCLSCKPGRPTGIGVVVNGLFAVFYSNRFIHVLQPIDDAYWNHNEFRDCVLIYNGGSKTLFAKANKVIDSDLEIGPGVPKGSPVLKQLLEDFRWRSVDDKRKIPVTKK